MGGAKGESGEYLNIVKRTAKEDKVGRPKQKPKGAVTSLYIKKVVSSLDVDWSEQSEGDEARFVKLRISGQAQPIVTHLITFTPDPRWKLYVHGQEVSKVVP